MKKVYVFMADGLEEVEFLNPVDLLRRGGTDVRTVSISGREYVTGSHQVILKADLLFEGTDFSDADALVLPGGGLGTKNLENYAPLGELLEKAAGEGKLLCAICAAPRVLGKLGLLKGHRATCYPGNEVFLTGAETTGEKVVRSGHFITSRGMGTATLFGLEILQELEGKETAEKVRKLIVFD